MTDPSPGRRELPEGSHLAYYVLHEIRDNGGPPEISVSASAKGNGGGVRWEFIVKEYVLGGRRYVRVMVFDGAFQAFEEIPEFFAALHRTEVDSIRDVLAVLGALGAVDETTRLGPSVPRRERLKAAIVDRLDGLGMVALTTGCTLREDDRGLIADAVLDLLGETSGD